MKSERKNAQRKNFAPQKESLKKEKTGTDERKIKKGIKILVL